MFKGFCFQSLTFEGDEQREIIDRECCPRARASSSSGGRQSQPGDSCSYSCQRF